MGSSSRELRLDIQRAKLRVHLARVKRLLQDDQCVVDVAARVAAVVNDVVFKSDSHAVKPIFFPGGDIGRLAISGTLSVNTTCW